MRFARIAIRGQNVPVFKKNVPFFNSIRGVRKGSFFKLFYSTQCVFKKNLV